MLLLVCPLGFDYGLGFMMFLLLIMNVYFLQKFSYVNFLMLNIMFMILMGIKSPFACIGLCGIGLGCIYELTRKNWKKAIVEGLVALLIFGLIYFLVVNPEKVADGGFKEEILFTKRFWEESIELGKMRSHIMNIPVIPVALKELLFFGVFIVLCHPVLILCMIICGIVTIYRKHRMDWTDFSFAILFIMGMGIGLYLYMKDDSQIYFALATYPLILLWISRTIDDVPVFNNSIILKLGMVCVWGYLGIVHTAWNPMIGYASVGRYNFENARQGKCTGDGYVSQSEYEILEYVKDNLSNEELIVYVNERNAEADRWFIAGVISEHKMKRVNREDIISRSELNKYQMDDYEYYIMQNDLVNTEDDIVFSNKEWSIISVN